MRALGHNLNLFREKALSKVLFHVRDDDVEYLLAVGGGSNKFVAAA
jgi:alcohol dehydrogenase YqhD (iron-dependent ADH family)